LNKVWKSVASDELLELDDEPLVADESVPLFGALVEFASPLEADELSSRISIWNDSLPLAGEPLLESVAAVLVGVVPVLFEPTVDVPELSAPVADVVPELALSAEVSTPEPAVEGEPVGGEPVGGEPVGGEPVGGELVGGELVGGEPAGGEPTGDEAAGGEPVGSESVGGEPVGAGVGPPWLPSTPCPANCCWKSLKSVCTSFNKVWKSVPSDEVLELDGETLVADGSVPLFDALAEFASPLEADELSSRTSSWNDSLPLAGEPLLGSVAPALVGVVPELLLIENDN
jgi:hypothetical protein